MFIATWPGTGGLSGESVVCAARTNNVCVCVSTDTVSPVTGSTETVKIFPSESC